jgi:hypothetical protein
MAAAPHGELEAVLARECDRGDDVGHALAARDQRRALVDHPVVDASDFVVTRVVGIEQLPREAFQARQVFLQDRGHCASPFVDEP